MSNQCFLTLFCMQNLKPISRQFFCQTKFKMRDSQLPDDYPSIILKYCDEHPDFTIKHFDASDAIARREYRF